MLTILPEDNKDILNTIEATEDTVLLVCRQDGDIKGYVAFKQNGYIIDMTDFKLYTDNSPLKAEDYILYDSILRSLGSYALNHSCFYIECSNIELFSLLKKFSFEENDNKLTINLKQLLKVCKN